MKKEIYLVLHNIRSAHNVGSIFRTADAAGVRKMYLCGYTPTPLSEKEILLCQGFGGREKISRTALGAEKYVPWEQHKQIRRLLEKLKKEGISIVALEQAQGANDYRKFQPHFPMALVFGNEVGGLSKEILKYADKVIHIPMHGKKESLNVSVATGVALFKIIASPFGFLDPKGEAVKRV